jgi:hypothetical protein
MRDFTLCILPNFLSIRRWPEAYLPKIFDASKVDLIMDVSQTAAEQTTRYLATKEGKYITQSFLFYVTSNPGITLVYLVPRSYVWVWCP